MGMQRLAHVDVTVTDLDLATAYYTEVIGMLETERDENSVYLKCWDEPNHHSLRLIYGPRVGFDLMSFKVDRDDDLEEFERRVLNYGFPVRRVSKGERVGQGESIQFETPSGQVMELVADLEMVGRATSPVNPVPFVEGLPGIAPPRLDHLLVTAEEVGDSTKFFEDIFGFRTTEQLLDGQGHQAATWLTVTDSPHDIAIVTGKNGGLHHFAWWLDD
ncbi:MAG: catechol 2,3-dioxygenase, partial [Actinomycetales bacterium]|nr:catechol 2,3-dioxygenase [Actinomycetales bacterium]